MARIAALGASLFIVFAIKRDRCRGSCPLAVRWPKDPAGDQRADLQDRRGPRPRHRPLTRLAPKSPRPPPALSDPSSTSPPRIPPNAPCPPRPLSTSPSRLASGFIAFHRTPRITRSL